MKQIEERWKDLTNQSNECFSKGLYLAALKGYRAALQQAEQLNRHMATCTSLKIPFIQVFIISCNNLSAVYEALENLMEAERMLKRSIYYLLQLAENQSLTAYELHIELKRASLAYLIFSRKLSDGKAKQAQLFKLISDDLAAINQSSDSLKGVYSGV